MNNIGEHIHKQVIDAGILPILVKIVKKKVQTCSLVQLWTSEYFTLLLFSFLFFHLLQSDMPVRERIFLLLDATQTSLGGASGKFPQYYNAYYELVVGTDLKLV